MHAFSARTAAARSSSLAIFLVRAVTYTLPTLSWAEQGQGLALTFALFLGSLEGWFRLRLARTAQSLSPEDEALVIKSGLAATRVAWSDVLAIEVWHRLNRVDYVAVHYRANAGNLVATCWEQGRREELLQFVEQCAVLTKAARPHGPIARIHFGDHAVSLALLRRLSLDLTLALLVGLLCGIASHAVWLGAAAGLVSTAIAATPYLNRAELVRRDGVWCERRRNGLLVPVRVLPPSLRLWAGYLSE